MLENNGTVESNNVYEVDENAYKTLLDEVSHCGEDIETQQECLREIAVGMGGASLSRRLFSVFFPTLGNDVEGR
jgi:hypothetical protein